MLACIRTITQTHEGQETKLQFLLQTNCLCHHSYHHLIEFSCFSFPELMPSTRYAPAYPEGQSAFWKVSKGWHIPLFLFDYPMIWNCNQKASLMLMFTLSKDRKTQSLIRFSVTMFSFGVIKYQPF